MCISYILWFLPGAFSQQSAPQGPQKVDTLLNVLQTAQEPNDRILAASELGNISDGTVADWMVRAFRNEKSAEVRMATLTGISHIPDHRIISPLLELVREELVNGGELLMVQKILWNFREAIHFSSWKQVLHTSHNAQEKAIAAWLLGVTGDDTIFPSLQKTLDDPTPFVRVRALQAMTLLRSQKGKQSCQRLQTRDLNDLVRKAAKTCVLVLRLTKHRKLPQEKDHKVSLGLDLRQLQTGTVTPKTFLAYQQHNVNPRMIDIVSSSLRPADVPEREDKSVALLDGERIRDSLFRLNVIMSTTHRFASVDMDRLREVVRNETASVNACYVSALRHNTRLTGDVVASFKIRRNGRVDDLQLRASRSLSNRNIHSCMMKKLAHLQFPTIPVDYVTMTYTFVFEESPEKG